ncbi:hypothetical protein Pan97_44340 [Bremerella volcania]|uniref:Uncharacterized protein n=1 Tax=Bremerella volcania TaxID=2527984 RepID=A0A518CDR8_9BACT|nr:hypothetical protein Pan97_44340 [Bremerella volcania]
MACENCEKNSSRTNYTTRNYQESRPMGGRRPKLYEVAIWA